MDLNPFELKVMKLHEVVENLHFEIPTFQRDFVWTRDQMITLIDSVYRGIPINSLYTWNCEGIPMKTGTESNKNIQLVVDGQQRLTSLKAMLFGKSYYNREGRRQRIEVAFHPIEGTFHKVDSKFRPNDKHVPNLATFYANPEAETTAYHTRNQGQLTDEEKALVATNLEHLKAMKDLPIFVYQISSEATLEQVHLCFERTNLEGRRVSQGDLCLAWLAAHQPLLAEGITLFCQGIQFGKQIPNLLEESPQFEGSPFAQAIRWIELEDDRVVAYQPKAKEVADLLFNIVLDGKKFDLGTIARQLLGDTGNAAAQGENQTRVDSAFREIVNSENFNTFNHILGQFRGINRTQSNYAYWLFLRCRRESSQKEYTDEKIARLLQRWYLLQLLGSMRVGGAVAFSRYLQGFAQAGSLEGYLQTLEADLPENFWTEQLPEKLQKQDKGDTRKVARAWDTVQILAETKALFDNTVSIAELHARGRILRHHLYPRNLLKKEGVPERKINAIANSAITTKEVNSRIGNRKLHRFIEDAEDKGTLENAPEHLDAHCIPSGAGTLSYEEFLAARAQLMAARIRKVYEELKQ